SADFQRPVNYWDGRKIIQDLFRKISDTPDGEAKPVAAVLSALGPAVRTLSSSGRPRSIARFDAAAPLRSGGACVGLWSDWRKQWRQRRGRMQCASTSSTR